MAHLVVALGRLSLGGGPPVAASSVSGDSVDLRLETFSDRHSVVTPDGIRGMDPSDHSSFSPKHEGGSGVELRRDGHGVEGQGRKADSLEGAEWGWRAQKLVVKLFVR
eukprot:956202-Rhodomonas_salina.4